MATPSPTSNEPSISDTIESSVHQYQLGTGTKDNKLANQENDHKFKDGERGDKLRTHIHIVITVGIYIVGLVLLSLIVVWAIHLIIPEECRWLPLYEINNIEHLIFSSIVVTLATKYFTKYDVLGGKH